MGFYYDPSNEPGDEDEGTFKEALALTLAVFKVLALPLGIMFGFIGGLVVLFVLFSIHMVFGLGALALIVLAVGVRAVWEWKHPPTLE